MAKNYKFIRITLGGALFALPFVLLALPVDFFDQGRSLCLSKILFNTECFGCGLTRAYMRLIHFDILGAWKINKLSILSCPFVGLLWVKLEADFIFDRQILRWF